MWLGLGLFSHDRHRNVFKPGGADRLDTYYTGGAGVLDAFPAQTVVDRWDHPCRHKNSNKLDVPDDLQILWLYFSRKPGSIEIDSTLVVEVSMLNCRPYNYLLNYMAYRLGVR